MHTLTIQIKDHNGLKAIHDLEGQQLIQIVEEKQFDSPALPGEAISYKAFRTWINIAEDTPKIRLQEAKAKWEDKRKQLQKLTR